MVALSNRTESQKVQEVLSYPDLIKAQVLTLSILKSILMDHITPLTFLQPSQLRDSNSEPTQRRVRTNASSLSKVWSPNFNNSSLATTTAESFSTLPAEVRLQIYETFIGHPKLLIKRTKKTLIGPSYNIWPLLDSSRHTRQEGLPVLYKQAHIMFEDSQLFSEMTTQHTLTRASSIRYDAVLTIPLSHIRSMQVNVKRDSADVLNITFSEASRLLASIEQLPRLQDLEVRGDSYWTFFEQGHTPRAWLISSLCRMSHLRSVHFLTDTILSPATTIPPSRLKLETKLLAALSSTFNDRNMKTWWKRVHARHSHDGTSDGCRRSAARLRDRIKTRIEWFIKIDGRYKLIRTTTAKLPIESKPGK